MDPNKVQIKAAAADLQQHVSGKMGDIWWAFMLRGLLAIALGISVLIWTDLTFTLLLQVIGVFALIDGVMGIIAGLRSNELRATWVSAVASLVIGGVLLFWPGVTLHWLMIILGIWAMLMGIGLFVSGRNVDAAASAGSSLSSVGAVLAIIGLVLVVWPGMGIGTISWFVAALAFLVGAILIFIALKLKAVNQSLKNLANKQ